MNTANQNQPKSFSLLKKRKFWIPLILILVFLAIGSFGAYYTYRTYYQSKTGVEYDPKTGATVIKAQIVDGQIVPPTKQSPIQLIIFNTKAENGSVKGTLALENKGNIGFEKLIYSLYLVGPDEKVRHKYDDGTEEDVLVDPLPIAQAESEPFSLQSGEKKTFDIELKYPLGAPSSDQYTFWAEIRPQEETTYTMETQKLAINQSGGYLSIGHKDCIILANNAEYSNQTGPNIDPQERVTAKCNVTNKGKDTVNAKSTLTTAERFVYKYTLSEEKTIDNTGVQTWQPNETKTITFTLPAQTKPEVYESILQFFDQNNQPVSPMTPFRYVVRGPSAIVRSAELQSAVFAKGDQIPVKIWASPSMDLFWNGTPVPSDSMRKFLSPNEGSFLRSPKLHIELTSSEGRCAQKTVDMPASTTEWNETTYDLIAERGCKDPTLIAKITEGDKELYSLQKNYFSPNNGSSYTGNFNPKNFILFITLTIIIILIIAIIVILIFTRKKKAPPVPPIVVLIIMTAVGMLGIYFGSAMLGHPAKAVQILGPETWISVHRGWTYEATYNTSTNIYYSGGRLYGNAYLNLRCNGGCSNCAGSLGARIWLKIDGQNGQVDGAPGGVNYVSGSYGGAGNRNLSLSGYLPGVDLTTNVHSAELWITPMYPASGQTSINIGDPGQGDHQCNMPTDICYGRVSTNWGTVPCSPAPPNYTTAACPAGQWGQVNLVQYSSCPGPTWGPWQELSRSCTTPTLTLSCSPTSSWASQNVTMTWNSANHQPGTTCSNNWNSFLPIGATSSGSDTRTLGAGNYNFNVSCSDGTSANAACNVMAVPAPSIALNGTSCSNSSPRVTMTITPPNLGGLTPYVIVRAYGGVELYRGYTASPVTISNLNFNDPYKNLTPNGYTTFYATTLLPGKTESSATALTVFVPNCPSPPAISYVSSYCPANQPTNYLDYQNSTYGAITGYHIDRNGAYYTTIPNGTHPYYDAGVLNNTYYTYSMRSTDNSYNSDYSNTVGVTSLNCTPPTVTVTRNTCNGNYPDVAINVTSPGNAGATLQTWVDMLSHGGNVYYNNFAAGQTINVANSSFASGYSTLQSLTTYRFGARSYGNGYSPYSETPLTTLECNGPKPFTLTIDNTQAICPADGLPRVNLRFTKSANATHYHVYVYTLDGAGNPATAVVAETLTSATLFPGIPIDSTSGTTTRNYSVSPNARYGAYVVAQKNWPTGSWIYSNNAAMGGASGESPWVYTNNLGWCDTLAPQITLMNLMQDCYQPDTWNAAQPMRSLVQDLPRAGAPANSVSGIRDVYYSLDPTGTTNYQYIGTQQIVGSNTYYDRTFTTGNFTSGPNRIYSLGANACDRNNNCSAIPKKDFLYTNICTGWIQTHGGNVHTEGNINAPGGPQ